MVFLSTRKQAAALVPLLVESYEFRSEVARGGIFVVGRDASGGE